MDLDIFITDFLIGDISINEIIEVLDSIESYNVTDFLTDIMDDSDVQWKKDEINFTKSYINSSTDDKETLLLLYKLYNLEKGTQEWIHVDTCFPSCRDVTKDEVIRILNDYRTKIVEYQKMDEVNRFINESNISYFK